MTRAKLVCGLARATTREAIKPPFLAALATALRTSQVPDRHKRLRNPRNIARIQNGGRLAALNATHAGSCFVDVRVLYKHSRQREECANGGARRTEEDERWPFGKEKRDLRRSRKWRLVKVSSFPPFISGSVGTFVTMSRTISRCREFGNNGARCR